MSVETVRSGPAPPAGAAASRAIRNVLANWTGYVVGLLVNFFLSPLIVNHLGSSAYGVWTLLVTLTAYLRLLDLGIRSAVTRYVARGEGRGDRATATPIVSTALAIFTAMAGLALVASAALGLIAPSVFHIPGEYRVSALVVAVLAGFWIFSETPETSFWAGVPLLVLPGMLITWIEYRARRRSKAAQLVPSADL